MLSQKDEKWTYTLVDTQFSGESKMVEKAKATLLKLSVGSEIDEQEKHVFLNILCFIWAINGLAEQVGVRKRINIIPEGMKQEAIDFLKIIR